MAEDGTSENYWRWEYILTSQSMTLSMGTGKTGLESEAKGPRGEEV